MAANFLKGLCIWSYLVTSASAINIGRATDAPAAAPIVNLGYAQYQGALDAATNITSYLGVRYAAPPTGALRWEAPQTPATVAGVQQATVQPSECFQAPTGAAPTNPLVAAKRETAVASSEDCLFLNVYFPGSTVPSPKLPVVVWIHGGGYLAGSASEFNGEDLIRDSGNGVVTVLIQYRLGVFGFLPGAKVKANGALNAGLLDQDFALRWVQRHISQFGGDATKVTIWGESAGAGSVLQHIVAHDGETSPQLFRAAMTSSTFLPSQYEYNDTIPEMLYSEVVAQTNCTTATDTLACLRAANVNTLQTANNNINLAGFFGTFVFVPVVDGTFITQRPTLSLIQGKVNGQILLSVTNTNEGVVFVNQNTGPTLNVTQYAGELFPGFGPQQSAAVAAQYAGLGTPLNQANAIMGESIFICPTYFLLQAFNGRSFKGEFAIPPGNHGEDVDFYFQSSGTPAFNNAVFIKAFSQAFLDVAMSLDPNVKFDPTNITPTWNKWSQGHTEMLFNMTTAGVPVIQTTTTANDLLNRCTFWESVGAFTGQ